MIMNLYRNIDRNSVQFDFIIDHPQEIYFAREIQELGGRIFVLPSFNGINIHMIKKAWSAFFDTHTEYKVLHSHVRSYASLYIPVAKNHGLITIIHSHSTSNGKGISAIVKKILQYPLRYQANYFFSCSKEAGNWLFGKNIVDSDKYYTLRNAIDIKKYKLNISIRKKYRLESQLENKRIFIHVGRFHPAKNHFFLLDIFGEWLKENPNDVLLLVGDGDLRSAIEEKIKEKKIENAVKLLGSRSDVQNLLQMADCFLLPSKWEGLPVTAIEAQASGLPCLISASITSDVFVTKLAIKVPVDKGINCWTEKMRKLSYTKVDVAEEIKQAGFDIMTTTEWLMNFYFKISGE